MRRAIVQQAVRHGRALAKKRRPRAADLVQRARGSDRGAKHAIRRIGDRARAGDSQAKRMFAEIQKYIGRHPVVHEGDRRILRVTLRRGTQRVVVVVAPARPAARAPRRAARRTRSIRAARSTSPPGDPAPAPLSRSVLDRGAS